jgi:hypothetical protein
MRSAKLSIVEQDRVGEQRSRRLPIRRAVAIGAVCLATCTIGGAILLKGQHGPNVCISQSTLTETGMDVEYRMERPFKLRIFHEIDARFPSIPTTGIAVRNARAAKSQLVAQFNACYSILRRDYFVYLRMNAEADLRFEANRIVARAPIWSAVRGSRPVWELIGPNAFVGNGVGVALVRFEMDQVHEERAVAYVEAQTEGE